MHQAHHYFIFNDIIIIGRYQDLAQTFSHSTLEMNNCSICYPLECLKICKSRQHAWILDVATSGSPTARLPLPPARPVVSLTLSNFHDYCTLESACVYNILVCMFVANSVTVDRVVFYPARHTDRIQTNIPN